MTKVSHSFDETINKLNFDLSVSIFEPYLLIIKIKTLYFWSLNTMFFRWFIQSIGKILISQKSFSKKPIPSRYFLSFSFFSALNNRTYSFRSYSLPLNSYFFFSFFSVPIFLNTNTFKLSHRRWAQGKTRRRKLRKGKKERK